MSPYIVTTKRLTPDGLGVTDPNTRHAVSSLDEARELVRAQLPTDANMWDLGSPESGGTVGPLPDGTVIEVERVNTFDLRVRTGQQHSGADPVAAFNAEQVES